MHKLCSYKVAAVLAGDDTVRREVRGPAGAAERVISLLLKMLGAEDCRGCHFLFWYYPSPYFANMCQEPCNNRCRPENLVSCQTRHAREENECEDTPVRWQSVVSVKAP